MILHDQIRNRIGCNSEKQFNNTLPFQGDLSVDMEMVAVKDVNDLGGGRHDSKSGFIAVLPLFIELNMEHLGQ
jgi:hypothetical protein